MGSKEPQPLPTDILARIARDFPERAEAGIVTDYVTRLHHDSSSINVGPSQFSRALLVLAAGDLETFLRLTREPHDPRDIIMGAEKRLGDPGHYCIPAFLDGDDESPKRYQQEAGESDGS